MNELLDLLYTILRIIRRIVFGIPYLISWTLHAIFLLLAKGKKAYDKYSIWDYNYFQSTNEDI